MNNLALPLISAILIGLGFAASKTSNPTQARKGHLCNLQLIILANNTNVVPTQPEKGSNERLV